MVKQGGISRRLDKLGRIVVPIEARRALGWEETTQIEIRPFGNYILLHEQDGPQNVPVTIQSENPIIKELAELIELLSDDEMLFVVDLLHCLSQTGRFERKQKD